MFKSHSSLCINFFYFIIGSMLPVPLFYDVYKLSFYINRSPSYTSSLDFPLPLGFIAILILCIVIIISRFKKYFCYYSANEKSLFYKAGFFTVALFFVICIKGMNYKCMALFFPPLMIFMLPSIMADKKILKNLLLGYLSSIFPIVVLHAVSGMLGAYNNNLNQMHIFFGYEIYQALISYSAILSVLGCTLLVFMVSIKKISLKYSIFLLLCLVYFLLLLGSRKAVLMDIIILQFVLVFAVISFFIEYKKIYLNGGLIVSCSLFVFAFEVLLYKFINNHTLHSFVTLCISQRAEPYMDFYNKYILHNSLDRQSLLSMINTENFFYIKVLFFGNTNQYCSCHNIILSIFHYCGLVGVILFILMFIYNVKIFYHFCKKEIINVCKMEAEEIYTIKSISLFYFLSIIFANLINLNYQLPYYVINFLFITISFFFLYCEHIKAKRREKLFIASKL